MNMADEEIKDIKKLFFKTLTSMKKRTTFTEGTYEAMNRTADEFTNALYAKIDEIWERNAEVKQ
ncbi:MAG TPA: hypothetical protein DCZ00_06210 [Lactococcus sp.]|uniref:hypothetical protein n=1 Tax=Lactococcus TaxID=1357 RepID=UPI000E8916BE|nr:MULTISPECIES: hypothetical protein [Lactococcus]HAP14798.1 hypothetical protein [Lactococcus sp.]HBC91020.1 hypothetical protein [Lactococcus sp.]